MLTLNTSSKTNVFSANNYNNYAPQVSKINTKKVEKYIQKVNDKETEINYAFLSLTLNIFIN